MPLGALTDAQLAFYSTAAQVIPVLLLVLALELPTTGIIRSLLPDRPWVGVVVTVLVYVIAVLMISGELFALGALRTDRVPLGAANWVFAALSVGVCVAAVGLIEKLRRQPQDT